MSSDLLVGVMTAAPSKVTASITGSILLVIVDKRVSIELAAAPARSVSLQLGGAAAGGSVRVLPTSGAGAPVATFVQTTRTLTITGLTGGDAVSIVLEAVPAAAHAKAAALHKWRFSTSRPTMSSIWTAQVRSPGRFLIPQPFSTAAGSPHPGRHNPGRQHNFYNFAYKNRAATPLLLAATARLSDEASVATATRAGHTLVTASAADPAGLHAVLNAALRHGAGVLVSTDKASVLAAITSSVGCHPNFAGFLLDGGVAVDAADAAALAELKTSRDAILQLNPHAFVVRPCWLCRHQLAPVLCNSGSSMVACSQLSRLGLQVTSARTAVAVLAVSNATGLPMVALSLPATGGAAETVKELSALRDALPAAVALPTAAAATDGGETALLVAVDPCAGTDGLARLQGYAALLFGASGVLYSPCTCVLRPGGTGHSRSQPNRSKLIHPGYAAPGQRWSLLSTKTSRNGVRSWRRPLPG